MNTSVYREMIRSYARKNRLRMLGFAASLVEGSYL